MTSAPAPLVAAFPVVTPAGLVVRPWEPDDADALSAAVAASIDHLRPWMPWVSSEPMAPAERVGLIERWRADREAGGDVVVGLFHDGVAVGGSGLHRRIGRGGLEIGYWVHVAHTRRGLATEAARALTGVALAVPGIERVEIHHDRANVASGGVPARLGFTLVEERARPPDAPGEIGVECRWVMTRAGWETMAAGV